MAVADALIDTGPLVGFLDKSDQWHAFAQDAFPRIRFPAYTCEAVISEATFLLRHTHKSREGLLSMIDSGALVVLPTLSSAGAANYIADVFAKYGDRADLADAALLWLAESLPKVLICTTDRGDFSRYRLKVTGKAPRLLAP